MQPFTRENLKNWANTDAFRRAEALIDSERIHKVTFEDGVLRGIIEARPRNIISELKFGDSDGVPENRCPCRDNREMGVFCHHAVGLCLSYLEALNDPARLDRLEAERKKAQRIAQQEAGASFIERVPLGTKGAVAVEIRLRLPADVALGWMEEGADVEVLVVHQGQMRSIAEVKGGYTLAMAETQDNILFVLEDIAEGPVPATLHLSPRDLVSLFDVMQGEWLLIGEHRVDVTRGKVTGVLNLDLEEDSGELVMDLELNAPDEVAGQLPEYLVVGRSAWVRMGGQLLKLGVLLPEPLQPIYRSPVRIARPDVPRFLETEWNALQSLTPCRSDVEIDWFAFEPANPGFRLEVRGSPASLAATLYAIYGDREIVAGSSVIGIGVAEPDPYNILRYRTRNLDAEKAAMHRLTRLGFACERGDQIEPIVGKSMVMNFCASSLPMLRRRGWKVDLEGRIVDAMDAADTAMPVISIQGSGDWFDVHCKFESSQGESLSLDEIRDAMRRGEASIQRNGKTLLFDRDAVERMVRVFDDCGVSGGEQGSVRMNGLYGAYLKSSLDALDGVDVEAAPEWMQAAERQNQAAKMEPIALGDRVKATLRPYQETGVSWLRYLEKSGFSGILADEMGLGKTLQTLSWLQLQRSKADAQDAPSLIVCPTSLVENWIEEGQRFVPHLRFLNLTGSKRAQAWEQAGKADVWVTSYAIVRRDLEKYLAQPLAAVVLDEAQHIKNHSTQNAQAVKQLQAHNRLVLTGTPVENSVSDLWSILDFLMPGYLGTHETFRQKFELPIRDGGDEGEDAQKRLQRKIHPFLLRRLKRDVAKDLPPKIEKVASCTMTKDQRLVYQELVEQSRNKMESLVSAQGFEKSRMEILTILLRLRQACCHLDLLNLPGAKSEAPSGKLAMFREMMLEAVDGGHRVLIFSQFTKMLGILKDELAAMDLRCCYLDGATRNRMDQVRQFQKDRAISAFLISLKAGGTGLNLTGADMVIHYDPWWNPAVEAQATDRAYRIGQEKTVYSLKLITKDSVEEKVLAMQRRKQAVIDATLDSDGQLAKALDWEDVQELLTL